MFIVIKIIFVNTRVYKGKFIHVEFFAKKIKSL